MLQVLEQKFPCREDPGGAGCLPEAHGYHSGVDFHVAAHRGAHGGRSGGSCHPWGVCAGTVHSWWMDLVVQTHIGAVLEELQKPCWQWNPCKISLGRIVSHVQDLMLEQEKRVRMKEQQRVLCNSHFLFTCIMQWGEWGKRLGSEVEPGKEGECRKVGLLLFSFFTILLNFYLTIN